MNEFIDLVKSIYPCIDEDSANADKRVLKQFVSKNKCYITKDRAGSSKDDSDLYDFIDSKNEEFLRQGDIFDNLPFTHYDENGEEHVFTTKAMLISNTCDASEGRDEYLHFAPLINIDDLTQMQVESKRKNFKRDLRSNLIFRFLYIPHVDLQEYVVNFHFISTFPSKVVYKALEDKKIQADYSLNLVGYYLFLCKLTVYFMRPEIFEETGRNLSTGA